MQDKKSLAWKDALYVAFIGISVFFFFWRLWIPDPAERARFQPGDFTHIFYPARYFAARYLAQGKLPLWNPYVSCGYPHYADPQAAVFYPVTWVTAVLSRGQLTLAALQWEAVFHYFLAGFFTFLFVRYLLGHSEAALFAALAFTFGGYLTGYPALQLSELEAAAWLPAALLLVTLAVDRASMRWAALAGVPLAMVVLAGRPQSYLSVLPLTIAWLLYHAHRRGLSWRHRLTLLAVSLAFGAGFAAVQVLPTWELSRLSDRSIFRWEHVSEGGFAWWELAGAVIPHVVGSYSLYPGVASLVLAGVALWRRRGLFWLWAALASLFVGVGKNGALFSLLYVLQRLVLPGYLRNPERTALAFTFSLALLGAYGFVETERTLRLRERLGKPLGLLAGLLLALWLMASLAGKAYEAERFRWLSDSLGYDFLLLFSLWALFTFANERSLQAGVVVILLLDLFTLNMGRVLVADVGIAPPFDEIARVEPLEKIPGVFRVDTGELGTDVGVFTGIEGTASKGPLQLLWLKLIPSQLDEIRWFRLANVHIVATKRRITHGSFKLLYEDDGLRFYAFFGFNPRAYLASEVRQATSPGDLIRILKDPDFDPATAVAVLEPAPELSGSPLAPSERVEITLREPTRVVLEAHAERPRLLVYSDVLYPGWRARLNGRAVPIYHANGVFRGVVIPPGDHRVEFVYRPTLLYSGIGVSFAAWLALAVLWSATAVRRLGRKGDIFRGGKRYDD